jgi:hypothetical protein
VHLAETETGEKGKHYRFPDFKEGKVTMKEGDPVTAMVNYNLVTEEIVVDLGHTKAPYQITEKVHKITIEDVEFISVTGVIYERLYEGPVALWVHRKQKMSRLGQNTGLGRTSTVSSMELPPDKRVLYELTLPGAFELKDIDTYFLKKYDELIPMLKLKNLNDVFPSLQNDLKTFIKKENIKMRNEEDLIKVVQFCNEKD